MANVAQFTTCRVFPRKHNMPRNFTSALDANFQRYEHLSFPIGHSGVGLIVVNLVEDLQILGQACR